MKIYAKLSALSLMAVGLTAIGSATTYQFGSYSTTSPTDYGNQNTALIFLPGLSKTGADIPTTSGTVNVAPGLWNATLTGTSSWVSYGQTGPTTPRGSQPGGHYAANGDYFFSTDFFLDSQATSFVFNLLADDTTTVFLDGTSSQDVFVQPATGGNVICQTNLPNCEVVDTKTGLQLPLALSLLTPGWHTLTFDVKQIKSVDLGIDFTATVDTAGVTTHSPVPEPGTLLLLGTGLIGSAGGIMRRMRSAAK